MVANLSCTWCAISGDGKTEESSQFWKELRITNVTAIYSPGLTGGNNITMFFLLGLKIRRTFIILFINLSNPVHCYRCIKYEHAHLKQNSFFSSKLFKVMLPAITNNS